MARSNYTPQERLAYGVAELAGLLGLCGDFLRQEIRRGNLKATRLGRRLVVPADEVARYLASGDAVGARKVDSKSALE